jgi:DNA modification methylase
MLQNLSITNPKRRSFVPVGRDEWFPYYAGFSGAFARDIIRSSGLKCGAIILDPWNGSGTTTSAASMYGYQAVGFDLNPAMAVAAKARLLPKVERSSIEPLLAEIENKTRVRKQNYNDADPLLAWFAPTAAGNIRSIDRVVHKLLIAKDSNSATVDMASSLSAIASFFYVALFRTVRSLLSNFTGSNPTWITRPASLQHRIRPSSSDVTSLFSRHVRKMSASIQLEPREWNFISRNCEITVASSDCLPIADNSIDFVLSSPPYCTRIDYGVATSPELAVLGFRLAEQLPDLRKRLIGTPTIQDVVPNVNANWGPTCSGFLGRLHDHPSKAAKSYYYKTYIQYFAAMSRSFSELSRCLKKGAYCVIVVQDSHFKNLHVDLASIFNEMACELSLHLSRRADFPTLRTFANINTRSRSYRSETSANESVLCFTKK